jgi:uncharacterized membrane protein YkvA (DUF1232 family)
MTLIASAKDWARNIKRDTVALYFAARNPETPMVVRLLAMAIAAYALSPIDLIPDFIPVLGYVDDLILVPLGLIFVVRLLPPHVLEVSRVKAMQILERPQIKAAAIFIVFIWTACAAILFFLVFRSFL